MPIITIERPYESHNQKKRIDVYINNAKVGNVGVDETVHFEVDEGKHSLMLKDQWPYANTSIKVDVSNNKGKHFKMTTSKWHNWMVIIGILIISFSSSLIAKAFNITSFSSHFLLVYLPLIIVGGFIIILISKTKKHLKLDEIPPRE